MSAQIDSTPAMLFLLNLGSFGTIGHFKEVSGIDHETEVIEDKKVLPDGKLATYRVAGMIKWSPIEMKRGIDASGDLWKWRETVIQQGQQAARGSTARSASSTRGRAGRDLEVHERLAVEVHGCGLQREQQRGRDGGHHHHPRGRRARVI